MKKTIFIPARKASNQIDSESYYRLLSDKGLDPSQPYTEEYRWDGFVLLITGTALEAKTQPFGPFVTTPYQKILTRAKRNKRWWG